LSDYPTFASMRPSQMEKMTFVIDQTSLLSYNWLTSPAGVTSHEAIQGDVDDFHRLCNLHKAVVF
jgi:hypothetical protein